MSDRSGGLIAATTTGTPAVASAPAERSVGAHRVAPVLLLDYLAAGFTFVAAAAYMILKVLNDNQTLLYPLIDETARWFLYLGIQQLPGLPEYSSLRNFADPNLAFAYMIGMAAVHLLAAAGFLVLARGLEHRRRWARRAHILVAALTLLILGGYASIYVHSTAPAKAKGLAVMAAAAFVPVAVIVSFLAPGTASLFTASPQADAAAASRRGRRRTPLPQLLIGGFLAAYVVSALLTVFVVSIPVAIVLATIGAPVD